MSDETAGRPAVEDVTTEADVRGWYWLRSELVDMARARGLPTSGSKLELLERVARTLAGRTPDVAPRRRAGPQLTAPLQGSTVIPPGQRCSQLLRAWFADRVGRGFRFDSEMRAFIAAGGATLDEAVEHWHATRGAETMAIAPQFEYNRFTRAWRQAHPDGTREDLLAAWWAHRSSPRPAAGTRD